MASVVGSAQTLRQRWRELNPDQRDLLQLRLVGLNDKEIASVLNRSHDAVRKEQSRTIRVLRDFVSQNPELGGSHV